MYRIRRSHQANIFWSVVRRIGDHVCSTEFIIVYKNNHVDVHLSFSSLNQLGEHRLHDTTPRTDA